MIKAGTKNIKKIFLGSTEIKKVYYGAQLIWNSLFFRFKDRVLADGGTLENEFIPDDKLNPSLLMLPSAYKAGKLYSVLPEDGSGDFTVERNSTATRVNKDGLIELVPANTPRIDWSTGGPMLLVEGQSTNLVVDSQNLVYNHTYLIGENILLPDPLGIMRIGNVRKNRANRVNSYVRYSTNLTEGTFIGSIWLRADSNASVITRGASITVVSITTNWQRFEIPAGSETSVPYTFFDIVDLPLDVSIYSYAPQLEQGSKATSYIPTNGSIVTRLADNIHNILPASGNVVITFADGTTQIISGNAGDPFTLPNGLIEKVEML